jgi:hypothetical protein
MLQRDRVVRQCPRSRVNEKGEEEGVGRKGRIIGRSDKEGGRIFMFCAFWFALQYFVET